MKFFSRLFLLSCGLLFTPLVIAEVVPDYHFIVISDPHVGATQTMNLAPSGPGSNDLDLTTYEHIILSSIQKLINTNTSLKPAAMMIQGDFVDHLDESPTGSPTARETQLAHNFYLLQKYFALPVYSIFGNNDSLLGDYQAFFDNNYDPPSPFRTAIDKGWQDGFLSSGTQCATHTYPCILSTTENITDGYYAGYLQPHLMFVALNSIILEGEFPGTYHGGEEAELNWFSQQLAVANQNQDSVVIMMHIPVGMDMYTSAPFWQPAATTSFLQTLQQYSNTVVAVFAGHTHMEELRIIQLDNNQVIPEIVTPALSTWHGNAPGFNYFTMSWNASNNRWYLKDFTTYYYSVLKNGFTPLFAYFNQTYCPTQTDPNVSVCLQSYLEGGNLATLLKIVNTYYTVGNPNYSAGMQDQNANDLVVKAVPSMVSTTFRPIL